MQTSVDAEFVVYSKAEFKARISETYSTKSGIWTGITHITYTNAQLRLGSNT